jgi:hypothetical protein
MKTLETKACARRVGAKERTACRRRPERREAKDERPTQRPVHGVAGRKGRTGMARGAWKGKGGKVQAGSESLRAGDTNNPHESIRDRRVILDPHGRSTHDMPNFGPPNAVPFFLVLLGDQEIFSHVWL